MVVCYIGERLVSQLEGRRDGLGANSPISFDKAALSLEGSRGRSYDKRGLNVVSTLAGRVSMSYNRQRSLHTIVHRLECKARQRGCPTSRSTSGGEGGMANFKSTLAGFIYSGL